MRLGWKFLVIGSRILKYKMQLEGLVYKGSIKYFDISIYLAHPNFKSPKNLH